MSIGIGNRVLASPPVPPPTPQAAPTQNAPSRQAQSSTAATAQQPKTGTILGEVFQLPGKILKVAAESLNKAAKRAKPIQLKVPFLSQFDEGHGFKAGNKACFAAAKTIARKGGANIHGSNRRIQVATAEDNQGRVTLDKAQARKGTEYIHNQLESGKPVVVGVSYDDYSYNKDKITDHFVTITGRNTDAKGRTYFTYHDPASAYTGKGSTSRARAPLRRWTASFSSVTKSRWCGSTSSRILNRGACP
jgi:hypothetical protein